ncbi:MAG TPA: hypothetical protein VEB40_15930 [Flavipsychrobacter sp.]|nr:hypothetical protein [Flavipsychrobacter sp.]
MKRIYLLLLLLLLAGPYLYAQAATERKPVIKAVENEKRLKLYPLEADAYINIYIEWPEMQAFTIAIYNNEGLLQHEWKEKAAKNYQKALSLANMPEGRYYMVVQGAKEAFKKDFIISRTK